MSEFEAAWARLQTDAARLQTQHLRQLFASDPGRVAALSFEGPGMLLDLSREKLDAAALATLLDLAECAKVAARRDAAFAGAPINSTENRAVLHMALRGGATPPEGADVAGTLSRFLDYAETVRAGPITDVINIGIGGSDLGPVMVTRALAPDHDGPRLHFVSNVDGAHLADTVQHLDPATTLVIIASKTFTTLETMTNARSARDWLAQAGDPGPRMAAVSTNLSGTAEFGIAPERVFGFWDWVGGRYSVWSAIGLPVALAVGADAFRAFLAGAAAMDAHFREAPLVENLPVLLALAGLFRRNGMGWPTVALIPYDQRLERFPAYVQQLDMESNGKRVGRDGQRLAGATGPVIWGEPGTNSQHSFFQLLHQGTDVIPAEFIAARSPRAADPHHHALLMANCLAQAQALAFGRTEAEVRDAMAAAGKSAEEIDRLAPHRTFPGDRPSTTLLLDRLDPAGLGGLVALYEHKVMVQGIIWGVNSYDQWGVELGKELASALIPALTGTGALPEGTDPATAAMAARLTEKDLT
ncbi:MAG: glucose-6-phosphate isomerase [Pseudomonadota bacterium]